MQPSVNPRAPVPYLAFKEIVFSLGLALASQTTGFAATSHWTGGACATPVVGGCQRGNAQNRIERSAPANHGSADISFEGSVATKDGVNTPFSNFLKAV